MSNDASVSNSHNYILIYSAAPETWKKLRNEIPRDEKQEKQYSNPDNDPEGPWRAIPWDAPNIRENLSYPITTPKGTVKYPPKGRCWAREEEKWNEIVEKGLEIEVSAVDPQLYRKNGEPLEKSLFEKVYQKEFNDLEKNTAWYLDENQCVHWWHRIAVNQRSYGLQGWQRHRIYPDLLACVHGTENGKFRFSVLETKGDHLKGNDDTEYKHKLLELLTRYADMTRRGGPA